MSIAERYSRFDKKDLSETEIARFFKMNAAHKMTWSRDESGDSAKGRRFERSDRKAEATVGKGEVTVTLKSGQLKN